MKVQKKSPWLTVTGEEISTSKLKRVARKWGRGTWKRYLDWYASPRQEALVRPGVYKKRCERQVESIFDQFAQSTSGANREACETLLSALPPLEARVLRMVFFEGRRQREIGANLGLTHTGVYQAKKRALARLRQVDGRNKVATRRYMKEEGFLPNQEMDSIWKKSFWQQPPFQPVRNPGRYDIKLNKESIEQIEPASVRLALLALAEDEGKMLYLRHWCCRSLNQIARELGIGVNAVEQISEAALSRVKRKVIHLETGNEAGGGSSCP